jgi:hypothetical protein
MLLPLWDGLVKTHGYDPEMAMLADRHYSRRKVGARQFVNAGRHLVLRDTAGEVLFVWLWQYDQFRFDGQTGYNCQIFRNESARLSSAIILEAEAIAIAQWGPNRFYTYVDPTRIRSTNPGACFKHAGWKHVGYAVKDGKHLLVKT